MLRNSRTENTFNVSDDNLLSRRRRVSERRESQRMPACAGPPLPDCKRPRQPSHEAPRRCCVNPTKQAMSTLRLPEHGSHAASGTRAHNSVLYLCDWCLESLLAIHINDLFMKFGATPKEQRPARPQGSPLKRQRETKCIFS